MNRSQLVPLVVAVLALSTLVVAATTLETTVTTDPDDEIDPNWERLPLSEQDAAAIQSEMTDRTESESTGETMASSGGAAAAAGSSTLVTPPAESLLDRLLALFGTLFGVVLGVVVLAGVAGLAYRYRGQYGSLFDPEQPMTATESPPEPTVWPADEPTHIVDRAWVEVVTRVDPDQPETTTPAECVSLARDADFDVGAVEAITTAFERVHYGGGTPDEESSRAQDGLDRLTGGQQ